MNIAGREPFRDMDYFFRRHSPSFGRLRRGGGESAAWIPAADIRETDGEYLISAELPAVKKEDVRITLDNGVLTLSGERRHEKERKDENEIRVESLYGAFSRSFSLPDDVDTKAIRAESRDGVLRIHVPRKEGSKPKAISIDVE